MSENGLELLVVVRSHEKEEEVHVVGKVELYLGHVIHEEPRIMYAGLEEHKERLQTSSNSVI